MDYIKSNLAIEQITKKEVHKIVENGKKDKPLGKDAYIHPLILPQFCIVNSDK